MSSTRQQLAIGAAILAVASLIGCKQDDSATTTTTSRAYSGTASVGDFLTVRLDPTTRRMRYRNTTNGQDYEVGYTIETDGTYTFADTTGNLINGYELPGFAMVINAAKAGPAGDTPALVAAIQTAYVTTDVFKNKSYNYMQFRTNSGGMEIGHVTCGTDGTISPNGYWPFGAFSGQTGDTFNSGDLPLTSVVANADHSALVLHTEDEHHGTETDYVFATPGGFLAVDTPNGAIVCMQQRSSSAFDPVSMPGTYQAVLYQKFGCTTGAGNVETSTSSAVTKGTLAITSDGHVTVTDEHGTVLAASALLTPLADHPELVGAGKLSDDCKGLFTFTIGTQAVFIAFNTDSLLLSSFTGHAADPGDPASVATYDYFYGLGLRRSLSGVGALPPATDAARDLALLLGR